MGEDSDLPVGRLSWGRIYTCRRCGQKIERGEDFILAGKVPQRWLYGSFYGLIAQVFEKDGRVYHLGCYQAKERERKVEARGSHSASYEPVKNEFDTF